MQNEQPFNCETLTMISERNMGETGEFLRSMDPKSKDKVKKIFGDFAQINEEFNTFPYFLF